jgi:quercetin dioxygenase-like cupin family protein
MQGRAPRAAGRPVALYCAPLERVIVEAVRLHRWDELSLEKVTEMVSRKIVAGERQTMAQVYLKRGALVPIHSHESEQLTYVLQGALRFLVNGEEIIVQEGEVLHIPSNLPHQAEALDDTFELDVFSPPRAVG